MKRRPPFVLAICVVALALACSKAKSTPDAGLSTDAEAAALSARTVQPPEVKPSATVQEVVSATPMIALTPKPIDSATTDSTGKTTTRRVKMDDAELARIVGSLPSLLAAVGPDVRFFTADIAGEIARKAKERERDPVAGVIFTATPVLWNPEGTQEYLVFTGRSKHSAFIAALKLIPPTSYELVSSFVFQKEVIPVVLAYKSGTRRELTWTTCWGCPGDQGGVSIRDDHHVVIVQH